MKLCHTETVETSRYPWKTLKALLADHAPLPENEGYLIYRIPGIVEAPNGDLLAYCECRMGGDWSAIDVCMRRSEDGGRSWSERQLIATGHGRATANNPVMIVDGDRIHFLYCISYKQLMYRFSDDSGYSWSEPVELTEQIDCSATFFWSCIAPGPGHGIKTHAGRLVVPVWFAYNRLDIYAHHPSIVTTLYSDDGGAHWQVGQPLEGEEIPNPNESALTELSDGRLLISVRNESERMLRALAISKDGGSSFSPMQLESSLPDPICAASVCTVRDGLLFTGCNSQTVKVRDHLTVRYWAKPQATEDTLEICPTGGYSDVCFSARRNRAYVLYECENNLYIRCAELSLAENDG